MASWLVLRALTPILTAPAIRPLWPMNLVLAEANTPVPSRLRLEEYRPQSLNTSTSGSDDALALAVDHGQPRVFELLQLIALVRKLGVGTKQLDFEESNQALQLLVFFREAGVFFLLGNVFPVVVIFLLARPGLRQQLLLDDCESPTSTT